MTGRGMWPGRPVARRGVSRRVAAAGATLALLAAGLVAAQLRVQPAAAITTSSASTIAAGVSHTCTIQSGKAYCWGDNTYGELGNGSTTSSSTPVPVSTSGVLSGVTLTQIVAGNQFTCALGGSTAYCWGLNTSGQLGNATTTNSSVPVTVSQAGLSGITAGYNFACGYNGLTGYAYCWGDNTYGELGNATNTSSSTPVAVYRGGALNGKIVASVDTGYYHACALDNGGTGFCWGSDSNGQLGNGGANTNSNVPVKLSNSGAISGSTVLAQISAGGNHTCALSSAGNAYCWGQNNYGELGNNSTTDSSVAVNVTSTGLFTPGSVAQITSGLYHTCALTSLGAAYCWGYGQLGQRGDNNNLVITQSTPVAVVTTGVLLGKTLTQISGGTYHTCAIDSTGVVYCWGQDSAGSGQVGDNGTATIRPTAVYVYSMAPTSVTAFPGNASATVYWTAPGFLNGTLTSYTATTSPGSYTCTSTSATHCTITGLTNGTTYTVTVTVTTSAGTSAASAGATVTPAAGTTSISAGLANSCVLQSGKAYCWGDNTYGEAGNNTTSPVTQLSPVAVYTGGALSGVTLTEVDTGSDFACGLSSAGAAYCWGYNNDGQLGDGTITNSSVPVAVTTSGALSGVTLTALSANRYTVCGLSSAGNVYCWGADDFGQLGNGGTNSNSSVPAAVATTSTPMAGATIVQISVGWEHACAIASTGAPYCWGDNSSGELGNGTTTSTNLPVAVTNGGVAASSVSAGYFETCGLNPSVGTYCWGNDQYGQLGNGTTGTSVSTPSAVTTSGALSGVTVTRLSVGQGHVCALGATGAAYCWGYDAYGQLGNNGITTPVNTPVAVTTTGTLSGVTLAQISAGTNYTCAQSATGTSYCWGSGTSGELGNNNGSANALTAVLVGPQAPTGVTASPGSGSATVSWTAPAYLNNGTLVNYTATTLPGSFTCVSAGATSCTITGLTGGTLYTITVSTAATTGTSAPSLAATVTPTGSLTMTDPSSLTWSGISTGVNQSIADGVAADQRLGVTDASGSSAGWHITMSATTVAVGGHTLPNASALDVNGSVTSLTGVAPSVACVSSCTLPTNTTAYPVAITTAASSPSAFTIYDTSAATGIGAVTIGGSAAAHPLGWWVSVPGSAYAGSYTSTITLTLVSGP